MEQRIIQSPTVLMVSGGADSVALLYKAVFDGLDLHDGQGLVLFDRSCLCVVHINHLLRGSDAQHDEHFTCTLAEKFGIACRVLRLDVAQVAQKQKANVEETGRNVRYEFALTTLRELCDEACVPFESGRILTAHSANDRAETFLMNATRGSGLAGLSSIAYVSGNIYRPLLDETHEDLEEYLRQHNQTWCIDQTNKDTRYLRSFVRYSVLPILKQWNPNVVETLASNCNLLREDERYMSQQADKIFEKLVLKEHLYLARGSWIALKAQGLQELPRALRRRVIKRAIENVNPDARIEHLHIQLCEDCLMGALQSASLCEHIQVLCAYGLLWICASQQVVPDEICEITEQEHVTVWGGYQIKFEHIQVAGNVNVSDFARSIADEPGAFLLGFNENPQKFVLGSLRPGDEMRPFGMEGHIQKVGDILSRQAIPSPLKQNIPIIRTLDGVIVLVGGIRSDERFRCRKNDQVFIKLTITASNNIPKGELDGVLTS